MRGTKDREVGEDFSADLGRRSGLGQEDPVRAEPTLAPSPP